MGSHDTLSRSASAFLGWFSFSRLVWLLSLSLGLVSQLSAQTGIQSAAIKQRLQGSFASMGWPSPSTQGGQDVDLLAAGTVRYVNDDGSLGSPLSVTIKQRGLKHYRMDIQTANGTESIIINDLGGAILASGKSRPLNASTAAGMKAPIFPFLHSSFDMSDPTATAEDASAKGLPTGTTSRVHLQKSSDKTREAVLRSLASDATVYLNENQVPVRIDFVRLGTDDHYSQFPCSLLFSDYRSNSGITVAYRVEERMGDHSYRMFSFDTIVIGPSGGITDSDFQIAAATGGVQ